MNFIGVPRNTALEGNFSESNKKCLMIFLNSQKALDLVFRAKPKLSKNFAEENHGVSHLLVSIATQTAY